jgi:hypothetical protein
MATILSSLLSPLSRGFSHRSFSPTSGHPSNCYLYCELLENEAPKEATERGCLTERQATEGMFSISPDLLLLAGSWGGLFCGHDFVLETGPSRKMR